MLVAENIYGFLSRLSFLNMMPFFIILFASMSMSCCT